MDDSPSLDARHDGPLLTQTLIDMNRMVNKEVDEQIRFYRRHAPRQRILFRVTGIGLVLGGASLPFLTFQDGDQWNWVATGVSLGVAALAALGSFFQFDKNWHGFILSGLKLSHQRARWELKIAEARMMDDGPASQHVLDATGHLLQETASLVEAETAGYFASIEKSGSN